MAAAVLFALLPQAVWAAESDLAAVPGEILIGYLDDSPIARRTSGLAISLTPVAQAGELVVALVQVPKGQERAVVAQLAHQPGVVYAEPNGIASAAFTPNDPYYADPNKVYAPQQVYANRAWDFVRGSGQVVVAVVDSGVDLAHPDLVGGFWINPGEVVGNGVDDDGNGFVDDVNGWDFVNGDNAPLDDHGHGTHVTGILAAQLDNGIGISGIAGGIRVLPVKVLSSANTGTWANIAAGIIYAANQPGVRAINLSLGCAVMSVTLRNAVEYAQSKGILVVAAAGNDASDQSFYPAAFDDVVAVAATTLGGARWSLSNFGSHLDIAAPGSTVYSTTWKPATGSTYAFLSGTSMAAPAVTGAAALLWSLIPNLSAAEVVDLLYRSAMDRGTAGWDAYYGHGEVDVAAAVQLASAMQPPDGVLAGRVWVDDDGDGQADVNETWGLAGVIVTLQRISGDEVQQVTTGRDGRYRFSPLSDGVYRVQANMPSGYVHTTEEAVTRDVARGVEAQADFGFILPTAVWVQALSITRYGSHLILTWAVMGAAADAVWEVLRFDSPDVSPMTVSAQPVTGQADVGDIVAYQFEDTTTVPGRAYWYAVRQAGSSEVTGLTKAVAGQPIAAFLPMLRSGPDTQ
jgi:subtilisin family serine protease